jgi:hypothetical protein
MLEDLSESSRSIGLHESPTGLADVDILIKASFTQKSKHSCKKLPGKWVPYCKQASIFPSGSMKKPTSLWFPNLQSWVSAVILVFTTGLLSSGIYNVAQITRIFDRMPPQWDIFIIMLALVSPIMMIAFAHQWINLVMDRFFPDSNSSNSEVTKGYWPTLSSSWEGIYGWLVIILATILCIGIGGLLLPQRSSVVGDMGLGEIYSMLVDQNKFKYLFSPPFMIWIFSAAYLYQFESVMRQHFARIGATGNS